MKRFARACIAFSGLILAVYTLWLVTGSDTDSAAAVSSLLTVIYNALVIVLGIYIASRNTFHSAIRRAWFCFSAASGAWAIAEILWFYYESILGIDPYPSPADFFYLIFYPFMLGGVLSMPFLPIEREKRALIALDTLIVPLVALLFLYYFILAPLHTSLEGGQALETIVTLTYPSADLLILIGLLSLLQRDVEGVDRNVLLSLSISMSLTAGADVAWAVFELFGDSTHIAFLNAVWLAGVWGTLIAAGIQIERPSLAEIHQPDFRPPLRDILIYAAPASAFILLLISSNRSAYENTPQYIVAVISVILGTLVMVRQYIVLNENRQLYKRMEILAARDQLTGLFNRRAFDETLKRETQRCERHDHALSLLMMDMDGFKKYNDAFGHLNGDVILKTTADIIRGSLRTIDILARYGGDEYVAILPETSLENAQRLAERISGILKKELADKNVGMTIGGATWQKGMTADDLIKAADQELYRLKSLRQSGGQDAP